MLLEKSAITVNIWRYAEVDGPVNNTAHLQCFHHWVTGVFSR